MLEDSRTVRVTDYIRDNSLLAGESLPSELRTSLELKISRGTVREAFRSLEVVGIIEKENGRSPRVGVLNGSLLRSLMVHAVSTRQISIGQVLQLRKSVEVLAAELAASNRTRADVQRLRFSVEGMRGAVNKPDAFIQSDLDFHNLLDRASGNPLIEIFCQALRGSMRASMRAGLQMRKGRADVVKIIEVHDAILSAVEKKMLVWQEH